MKRWFFSISLLGIFFFTAVAFISWQIRFPLVKSAPVGLNPKFYDYAGITHVHSNLSTGSGTIEDITRAASKARCNFAIVTDLNTVPKNSADAGYRDDVLVILASEYSYLGGHLLTYGFPNSSSPFGLGMGQAQVIFNELLQQNPRPLKEGFLVAAHPFLPRHSWDNLQNSGLTGIEILNIDSIWRTALAQNKLSIIWSFLILPFNPDLSYLRLFVEPQRELAAWDENLRKRFFVGFAGADATANAIPFPDKSIDFPSYTQSFRLMKNHVLLKSELTGSYNEDRTKILEALYRGSFYFSLDVIGDPTGFYFIAQKNIGHNHQEFVSGQTLPQGPAEFVVELGREVEVPHEIVLLRNGQPVATSNSSRLNYETKTSGAYRAVVRVIPTLPPPDGKKWFPWIFSNAIRLE